MNLYDGLSLNQSLSEARITDAYDFFMIPPYFLHFYDPFYPFFLKMIKGWSGWGICLGHKVASTARLSVSLRYLP